MLHVLFRVGEVEDIVLGVDEDREFVIMSIELDCVFLEGFFTRFLADLQSERGCLVGVDGTSQ